jgi:hypothetical protein
VIDSERPRTLSVWKVRLIHTYILSAIVMLLAMRKVHCSLGWLGLGLEAASARALGTRKPSPDRIYLGIRQNSCVGRGSKRPMRGNSREDCVVLRPEILPRPSHTTNATERTEQAPEMRCTVHDKVEFGIACGA